MNDSFLFYESWWTSIIEEFDDEDTRKDLIFALVKYGISEEKTFPTERLFLKNAYKQIDIAKKKYSSVIESRSKAGKSGVGESKARYGNKNATKRNKTQHSDSDSVTENVSDSDSVSVSDSDSDSYISSFGNSLEGNASEDDEWMGVGD